MKIAVLMGGTSDERAVSLKTGEAVVTALENLNHETLPLVLEDTIQPLIPTLEKVDLVFNALHGGSGENGVISGFLESLGTPYTGSNHEASAICMNKHLSKLLVKSEGLQTPRWEYLKTHESIPSLSSFTFPLVIKPNDQGSTIGLSIVHNQPDVETAIALALKYGSSVLIEEFVAGREITVSMVGNEVLPIVEIVPSHELYDYSCKYEKGLSQYFCPADIHPAVTGKIQAEAMKIYQLLGCRHYARIDFRLSDDNCAWFLEANTLPGMTETSLVPKAARAAGYSFDTLIEKIIEEALKN
jgi:D-alanine-D-alanine ligase